MPSIAEVRGPARNVTSPIGPLRASLDFNRPRYSGRNENIFSRGCEAETPIIFLLGD